MHAKETVLRHLDHQYEVLCQSIDETVQKDLENLAELEDYMRKEIENMRNLVDNGRYMYCYMWCSYSFDFFAY